MQPRTAKESLRHLKQPESASDGQAVASDGLKAQAQLWLDGVSLQIMQDWVMGSSVVVPGAGVVSGVVPDSEVDPGSADDPASVVVVTSVVVTGGSSSRLQSGSLQGSQLLPIHPSGKSDKHPRFT